MESRDNEWWAGYTGDPFGNMGQGLCENCKRRAIDRSEDPKSVLCKECREELIRKKKRRILCIGAGAAVVCICAAGVLLAVGALKKQHTQEAEAALEEISDTKDVLESKDSSEARDMSENEDVQEPDKGQESTSLTAENGYILTEMNELLDALEKDPEDINTAFRLTDIGMKYGYYDYASYAINQYIAERDISDKQYRKVIGYVDKLNIYYDTCDLSDELVEQVYEDIGEDGDPYEAMEQYCEAMSVYIGSKNYDQALVYYCLGSMTADDEVRMNYLKECIEINPYYFDAQAQIATYYRRQGELEQARQILEEIYAVNKEDYAVLRSYATLELVEGNLEKGLDYALRAYELYEEGNYVVDTYIVALVANGRVEEAKELAGEYEGKDYEFDEEFYRFLDGNMTLEEYYIGD